MTAVFLTLDEGWHQKMEFRENQGILFSIKENQGEKERLPEKSKNVRELSISEW